MWAMIQRGASMSESIALPPARICIGVTGHRDTNPAFAANHDAIEAAVTNIFESVARVTSQQNDIIGTTRLYSLMALGADAVAIKQALQQDSI
jgi:phosphoglucomutase